MRKRNEIEEYMDEALDMVWLVRTFNLMADGTLYDSPADIVAEAEKHVARICEAHNVKDSSEISDWEYGYWSGILAALRWVTGEKRDMLDT